MIDNLFMINLKRRPDKLKKAELPIDKFMISKDKYKVFEAIDCKSFLTVNSIIKEYQNIDFDPIVFKSEYKHINNTERYRAKFACWLSHYSILQKFENSESDNWIIIMEDDCIIQYPLTLLEQYMKLTIKVHSCNNNNIDMIVLSDRIGICTKYNKNHENLNHFKEKCGHFGTDCYAVKKSSIKKFIQYLKLDQPQNKCSIDNALADLNDNNIIKIVPLLYKSFGLCCDRESKNSDIEVHN